MSTEVIIVILVLITILLFLVLWIFTPVFNASKTESVDFKQMDNIAAKDYVDISIIMPAYNEETRLPTTLDAALQFIPKWAKSESLSYELMIVDDGSSDKTSDLVINYINRYPSSCIRLLTLPSNKGKGGAIKRGVANSKGKYILMADADGATDIRDLNKLFEEIKSIQKNSEILFGDIGIVLGSRAHLEEQSTSSRAFYRTILMYGFHLLVSLLCTKSVRDTQCGFKLFTKSAARKLFSNLHLERWAFDIELIYLAETLQIPMTEVSVNWTEIPGSKLIQTKLDVVTTSMEMARDILCVRLAYLLGIWKMKF